MTKLPDALNVDYNFPALEVTLCMPVLLEAWHRTLSWFGSRIFFARHKSETPYAKKNREKSHIRQASCSVEPDVVGLVLSFWKDRQ